jgi:hypothetical protein
VLGVLGGLGLDSRVVFDVPWLGSKYYVSGAHVHGQQTQKQVTDEKFVFGLEDERDEEMCICVYINQHCLCQEADPSSKEV